MGHSSDLSLPSVSVVEGSSSSGAYGSKETTDALAAEGFHSPGLRGAGGSIFGRTAAAARNISSLCWSKKDEASWGASGQGPSRTTMKSGESTHGVASSGAASSASQGCSSGGAFRTTSTGSGGLEGTSCAASSRGGGSEGASCTAPIRRGRRANQVPTEGSWHQGLCNASGSTTAAGGACGIACNGWQASVAATLLVPKTSKDSNSSQEVGASNATALLATSSPAVKRSRGSRCSSQHGGMSNAEASGLEPVGAEASGTTSHTTGSKHVNSATSSFSNSAESCSGGPPNCWSTGDSSALLSQSASPYTACPWAAGAPGGAKPKASLHEAGISRELHAGFWRVWRAASQVPTEGLMFQARGRAVELTTTAGSSAMPTTSSGTSSGTSKDGTFFSAGAKYASSGSGKPVIQASMDAKRGHTAGL
mmetsp:Transcript_89933/g.238922  ORF Transcript_89933/g.238922 Transcript_89933/m.238922 type:complete len:423 (+) Transcript_89933:99-1367(+)